MPIPGQLELHGRHQLDSQGINLCITGQAAIAGELGVAISRSWAQAALTGYNSLGEFVSDKQSENILGELHSSQKVLHT